MACRLTTQDSSPPVQIGQSVWWRSELPGEVGHCITDKVLVDEGLALAYSHYQSPHDLLETSTMEREGRCLTLTIALEGASSTVDRDGQRFDFIAGHSTMAAFASVQGERRFPPHQRIRQLRLIAEERLLQRYGLEHLLDGVGQGQTARPLSFHQHGGATQQIAQTLVHLHGRLGSLLDLQVAALALLAEHTRPFTAHVRPQGILRTNDQEKILRARDILARHYAQPLTVAYLCTTVGTNECKLKQGFRDMFGTSPHRMLVRIRMEKAMELLDSGLRVSTVADHVGYQHLSSFSTAFERYFGRPPSAIKRARTGH